MENKSQAAKPTAIQRNIWAFGTRNAKLMIAIIRIKTIASGTYPKESNR